MSKKLLKEINQDRFRKNLNIYTIKAFRMLPRMEKPRILDIGCGSGVPTLELARLCDGLITGIDIDESLLDELCRKIKEEDLTDRVTVRKCSLFEIDYPNECFDIVWAEGSISNIGFERGLREWRRLLKTGGFMVIHDDIKSLSDKLMMIPGLGYNLVNHFSLPMGAWWTEYYKPLGIHIKELCVKYVNDQEALKILERYQNEVDVVEHNPNDYGSVFYVMQKIGVT